MKLRTIYVSCILATFAIISCSKDEQAPPASKAALITRKWKQADLLIAQPGSAEISVFGQFLQSCEQDNIWEFKTDGSYVVTEGASKCDSGDPDIVTAGTWQLAENETKLVVNDLSDGPSTLTIVALSQSSFRLRGTEDVNGVPMTATIVFSAQ